MGTKVSRRRRWSRDRHPRSYERHRDFEHPDRPRALLEQRRKASTQRLLQRFVSLTARADEYYRALDKLGNTIDFYLAAIRNTKAAKRFLSKALRGLQARLSS